MRFTGTEGSLMVKLLRNVVLVLFLIIFVSVIYNFRNKESDTESALIAEAIASEEFKGVFIRDEKPVTYSGSGVLSYNVSDGGKLGTGSIIAQVYSDDSQISRNREKAKLQKELDILMKIQNPGTRESAQPADISANIEENYRELMLSRDRMDLEAIAEIKDELLINMSTYQIITDEVSDFSQQILDLNTNLSRLERQEAKAAETITSPESCYFVSYCDGYESVLTKDSIGSLTVEKLKEITDTRLDDPKIVGKLVKGYNWYLAGIVDNKMQEYKIDNYVSIRPESSEDVFQARIVDIRTDGDPSESLLILSCREFSKELVQHRVENIVLIRDRQRGLKVPREAIRFATIEETEGEGSEAVTKDVTYKGVYVLSGERVVFKKIDVCFEGSDYVLSSLDHIGDDSYLMLYDDIMIEGVD